MLEDHIAYLKDNPHNYWFKAKLYGWGWVPVRWQGWVVLGIFVTLVLLLALPMDEYTTSREVIFNFALPGVALTGLLILICYKTGEKPRFQWGPPRAKKKQASDS